MPKLTNEFLKNALPMPGKRIEQRDEFEPRLIFRVTDKGQRSWSVRYRNANGTQRRKFIGPYPAIGLAMAREQAREIKGQVAGASKIDVVGVQIAERHAETTRNLNRVAGLAEAYFSAAELGLHRVGDRVTPKRTSTIAEERRIYKNLILPRFGSTPVSAMMRIEIQEFVTRLSQKSPANGRQCRAIIRQLLSYALLKGIIDHNPATQIAVVSPKSRQRVLADEELKAIWQACKQPSDSKGLALSRQMGCALLMAMLTMQRGGSVISMRWNEIHLQEKLWLIPSDRMKGKRQHMVPLSEAAISLLGKAKAMFPHQDFVFPSPRKANAMDRRAFSRAMKRVTTSLGIADATPHDFRRTAATMLTSERIGIPRFIVSQVLAHSSDTGGAAAVTSIYDVNDYLPEKRRALDAWAQQLLEIVEGQPREDNVVAITG